VSEYIVDTMAGTSSMAWCLLVLVAIVSGADAKCNNRNEPRLIEKPIRLLPNDYLAASGKAPEHVAGYFKVRSS
jgi:hypothetical protein